MSKVYEDKYHYTVRITGIGVIGIYASTKYEAVEKAYARYCHMQHDRKKYHATRKP